MSAKIQQFTLAFVLLMTSVTSSPMCVMCGVELENKVAQIEAKQAIVEGRSGAMTQTFMNVLSSLKKDSDGIKTAVGRLVEDSVDMRDNLNRLQGLGEEVVTLRNKVGDVKKVLSENISEVQGQVVAVSKNMEVDKTNQARNLNRMNQQLNENKGMLDGVRGKMGEQTKKLAELEQKMAVLDDVKGSPASLEALQGAVAELSDTFNRIQDKFTKQLNALRNSIEDRRWDDRDGQLYPNH